MKKKLKNIYDFIAKNKRIFEYIILIIFTLYFIAHKLYFSEKSIMDYGITTTKLVEKTVNWKKIPVWIFLMVASAYAIHWDKKISERWKKIIGYSSVILAPVFIFCFLELLWYHSWLFSLKMKPYNILMNLLILGFIVLFFSIVFNDSRLAVEIPLLLCFLFQIANLFVYRFRENPIIATDFKTLEAAATVAGQYDYTLNYKMLAGCVVVFDIFIILHRIGPTKLFHKRTRFLMVILGGIWLGCIAHLISTEQLLLNAKKTQYRADRSYKQNGTALTLVGSIQLLLVEKPDNYSVNTVNSIIRDYESDRAADFDVVSKPNIICVMDESFCDMTKLYDIRTSEETLDFFNGLTEDVVSANLYVSIYGGQTANTEYEILTGNTIAFLPAGLSPYQEYLEEGTTAFSLGRQLKTIGYQKAVAIHPFSSLGYNRIPAYDALGFDDFLDEYDFSEPVIYRSYISDESSFDKIIETYEESNLESDAPIFIHNVTMQNHGGFSVEYENFPLEISVENPEYKDDIRLQTFMNLLSKTDDAYEGLIDYFKQQEEPTLIVFYGDHHPSIPVSGGEDTPLKKYSVPIKIWANYDIEEQDLGMISPNYVSAYLTEMIGAPLTGYQKFLMDLYKEIPVITAHGYICADGVKYKLDDTNSPYYSRINEYHNLIYNNIIDKENMVTSFFYLKQ